MQDHDFRIELFVFPDGTEIEMLVFEPLSEEVSGGAPDATGGAPHDPSMELDERMTAAGDTPLEERASDEELPPETDTPHSCPVCGSELVYPVDWRRVTDTAWRLRLRCPECETERDATLARPAVEDFNRRLYYGSQELAQAAEAISRRNFEEEAAKLVAALELDLILPMDF